MSKQRINPALLFALAILIAGAMTADAALAQGPGRGEGRGHRGMGPSDGPGRHMLAERLDLTEEQVAAADKLREERQAARVELRKELMRLRHELRGEMMKDEPSEKAALELTRRIGEVRTRMQENRLEGRLAFRKLLTPEQRDRMLMMGERGERGNRGERDGRRCEVRGGRGGDCDRDCERGPRRNGMRPPVRGR